MLADLGCGATGVRGEDEVPPVTGDESTMAIAVISVVTDGTGTGVVSGVDEEDSLEAPLLGERPRTAAA